MDGYTHTDIPFPEDRLNGIESQRRRALERGGQQCLTWPEHWTWSCRAEAEAGLCHVTQLCDLGHLAQPQQASVFMSVVRRGGSSP